MRTEEKLDTIGRDEIIKNISDIVESVSLNRGNTTFAIDGDWGCGKTFVLEKLEKNLSEIQNEETADNRYFIIHYNSWKYDYYEEPLVAIVSAIVNALDEDKIIKDSKARVAVKEVFKQIGAALLDLANASVKKITSVDVKDKISTALESAKKAKEKSKEKIKEINKFDNYFDLKNLLAQLKKSLNQLSEKYTIVFAVDELDRCLPEYAIKVMERFHHLTEDVENIVTIIAIDKKKLKKTISSIFGYELDYFNLKGDDCSKYLKKFIKFSVKVENGEIQESIKEKYKNYLDLFENQLFEEDDINFTEFYNSLFAKIDVREQETLMEKVILVHQLITKEKVDKSLMYLELIFTFFEHYEHQRIQTFFSGTEFNDYSELGARKKNITKLNEIFKIEFRTRREGNVVFYHLDESAGIKGFICWVLSFLKNDKNPFAKQISYNAKRIQANQKDLVLNHINKFREFMLTVIK